MEKIAKILRTTDFDSSSQTTQQFKNFVSDFKKEFKKEISNIGGKDVTFNIGHFCITGFFEFKNQLYYFSLSDVRGCNYNNSVSLLYRTAEHRKDWSGGGNQWVTIGENMGKKMFNLPHYDGF